MPSKMVKRALEYNWKCAECKTCSKCLRTTDETKMLFCDQCDRGYHIYCLGLRNVPEGKCFFINYSDLEIKIIIFRKRSVQGAKKLYLSL